jgi:hypothetical protein
MNASTVWFIAGAGRGMGIDITRAAPPSLNCRPGSRPKPERHITKEP